MPYSDADKAKEWRKQYYQRRKDYFRDYPKLHGHLRTCTLCSSTFRTYDKRRRFCSKSCAASWSNSHSPKRLKSEERICEYCNKKFRLWFSEIKKGRKGRFCCKVCKDLAQRGIKRPKHSEIMKEIAVDKNYVTHVQNSVVKRPTDIERYFINFVNRYNLPFRYTGNGELWLGSPPINPDFVHREKRVAVELLGSYWHSPDETANRAKQYEKMHWKVLFLWDRELYEADNRLLTKLEVYV